MCIHEFEQARILLLQIEGDVGRQLELWRLQQWAQPVNHCLEVEVLLDCFCHCGAADLPLEFAV